MTGLVVQGFNDSGKNGVLAHSPKIQRASRRIILAITAVRLDLNFYHRDMALAYVQSPTSVCREIYGRLPSELGLDQSKILKIEKPLNGLAESENHWFFAYRDHHTKTLGMTPSKHDPCLLCRTGLVNTEGYDSVPFGLTGLQTDDTPFLANHPLTEIESGKMTFASKQIEQLIEDHNLQFNGGLIKISKSTVILSQEAQCKKLGLAQDKSTYIAQRARGSYVPAMCQPEAAFNPPLAAQIKDPQTSDIERINKCLIW